MKDIKNIKNWEELKDIESPTHLLDIDLHYGCAWITPKQKSLDPQSYEGVHYLSTHTFYDNQLEQSSKLLQSCGFEVNLVSWEDNTI